MGTASGAVGDGIAQTLERRESGAAFDARRWVGVTTFSCFCSVALYTPFYAFLDRRFGGEVTKKALLAWVVLDDGLFVPGVEVLPLRLLPLPARLLLLPD